MKIMNKIYPVILAGGSGKNLWPLSREVLPKQFLSLLSDKTLLQETALHLANDQMFMPPLIICGNEHRFLVAEQMRAINIKPLSVLLESKGRDTAPATAVAARYITELDSEATILVIPADYLIKEKQKFYKLVESALPAALTEHLVTFGIEANSPETKYSYIKKGDRISSCENAYKIERYVRNQGVETALGLISSQSYFWNTGMFLFGANNYLVELEKYRPVIYAACKETLSKSYRDLDFCRLDKITFDACPAESIDLAVMENSQCTVVMESTIGWNDVGSWSELWSAQQHDLKGNVHQGDVYLDNVNNSLVRAESRCVAVIGLDNIIVVETKDAILVTRKDHAHRVEQVVSHLKTNDRKEYLHHTQVYRPWGSYEGIDLGERFQVKRIVVNPGEKLSLQMHHHRAEHWIVVSGTGKVTCGNKVILLTENESTYIPIGMTHRLENSGKLPLHMIEVQSGSYLGEDDIVRFEDIYKRS